MKVCDVTGGQFKWMIFCPGCQCGHGLTDQMPGGGGPGWSFNGDYERPTFSPSLLIEYNGPDAGHPGRPVGRCHSFITDGKIQFLMDCTHGLKGQTVALTDI